MSVFDDFQRMWMQRFPQSSLSDAWEQDVRASLDRHKQKIAELSKELEQETLYVEYLERLLLDVEKYRQTGGDATALFEANNAAATSAQHQPQDVETASALDEPNKSSLNLRESTISETGKDKSNRLSLNTDNKYAGNNSATKTSTTTATKTTATTPAAIATNANSNEQQLIASASASASAFAVAASSNRSLATEATTDLEKADKDVGNAMHKCMAELSASMCAAELQQQQLQQQENNNDSQQSKTITTTPTATATTTTTATQQKDNSHFVTVIEVKESKDQIGSKELDATIYEHTADSSNEITKSVAATFTSFERQTSKIEPTAPPLSPAQTNSSSAQMSTSTYAARKLPPKLPPKYVRRVEPPTVPSQLSSSPKRDAAFAGSAMPLPGDSPISSLERNLKPSDILRQKSNESLEAKSFAANRKTTPELAKYVNPPELLEELGRKVVKTDSLEKSKANTAAAAASGSLGRAVSAPNRNVPNTTRSSINATVGASPTGSLNKNQVKLSTPDSSSTGSLEKKTRSSLQTADTERQTGGSKESLASQGISEIIKSYESVSSLSSEGNKAAAQGVDNEPYYDTVPLDNGDGEYVFIKPGGNGSSSSRDDLSTPGSTLPMGSSIAHLSSQTSVTDPESPGRSSNYANIEYFLQQNNETRSSSLDSDGEFEAPPIMRTISHDEQTAQQSTPGVTRKNLVSAVLMTGQARGAKIRSILSSIVNSESTYVECLNKMIQYKKAIHATINTSQPVIKQEEEQTIFFKIDELYEVHTAFLSDIKAIVAHEGGDVMIGEAFKRVADMFDLYSAFLDNYGQAIDTVKKCCANNPQFKKIVSTIVVNLQNEQSLTLEDLLHKPVARVQINAMVLNDLLRETPPNHPDHQPLRQAHKIIHAFLKQVNVANQHLPTESNKNLRRMVKNSFIVELVDGHRKLRHLFLFNDVIACAKYKASGRDRIDYELKWYIPLKDVVVFEDVDTNYADLKESSPANILQLKTQACTVRDQLLMEEKDEKSRKINGLRSNDKIRRKLADLESQLVLASPNLVFRIANKLTNKPFTFFLSSDYERTHWIESILSLKQNCNVAGANNINALEVHAFIVAMQKGMKTEMGSYLMRNTNDESLLVGDLHITVHALSGLEQPSDLYICIEVDSYGHYFRKATTKMVCRNISPNWNESFVLELEGSQNVRTLLYEAHDRPKLKAKNILKLSRSWLQETGTCRIIKMGENLTLNITLRFVPGEITLRRVPTAKPGALFGAKMSQVLKREKRDIPFIISACIREVERRGMSEVGIYRVSGSASDLAKLKKSFETNAYEAEQLLKDVDIHSVTGILKSYLRDLPEALYSDLLYPKFFETFSAFSNNNETARINELSKVFEELPQANKASINHILDHLIRVHHQEADNKMSLHNLAMVFGPTLLRPGQTQSKQKDLLASSTVDVMAQAGILYCFLQARIRKE